MGIPGFATRMRPYGSHEVIGRVSHDDCKAEMYPSRAVIDGPSLAHFIFQSIRPKGTTDGALLSSCNYSKLGIAMIQWLDQLTQYGFEVVGIYFDGALPSYKKEIRIERMQDYLNKLGHVKTLLTRAEKKSQEFESHRSSNASLKRPEPTQSAHIASPLMVFATVEALSESNYRDRTWIVNGEADTFCASAALQACETVPGVPVAIFTNDSDLILYDINSSIKVVMINDVQELDTSEGKVMQGLVFRPAALIESASHSIQDMMLPAWKMQLDHHVSFRQAMATCRVGDRNNDDYRAFERTYDTRQSHAELKEMTARRREGSDRPLLDPRVSELIYAVTLAEQTDQSATDNVSQKLNMYLPNVFEDPTRGSAWKIGRSFRAVAETAVINTCNLRSSVHETRRSGPTLRSVETEQPAQHEIDDQCRLWTNHLRTKLPQADGLNEVVCWRIAVMQLTLGDILDEDVASPDAEDIVKVLSGAALTTWSSGHLSAQYQAEFYSVRMLNQVLGWRRWLQGALKDQSDPLSDLHHELSSLPNIAHFFDETLDSSPLLSPCEWEALVTRYCRELRRPSRHTKVHIAPSALDDIGVQNTLSTKLPAGQQRKWKTQSNSGREDSKWKAKKNGGPGSNHRFAALDD